jgi:hypothetical protein
MGLTKPKIRKTWKFNPVTRVNRKKKPKQSKFTWDNTDGFEHNDII